MAGFTAHMLYTSIVMGILEPCDNIAYSSAVVIYGFKRIILRYREIDEYTHFCRGSDLVLPIRGMIGLITYMQGFI